MPARSPFSYAVYRLVPDLERGERINCGTIVFCRPLDFVGARTLLDEARLAALAPGLDPAPLAPQLAAIERIAAGDAGAGPIAQLDTTARFHWLTAPTSTMIRPSAVHTGMCDDPQSVLDELFDRLVAPPRHP
ncbi:MAG TPA: DUF3037 domain-containing protein [Gaiellaceae bacterium]